MFRRRNSEIVVKLLVKGSIPGTFDRMIINSDSNSPTEVTDSNELFHTANKNVGELLLYLP